MLRRVTVKGFRKPFYIGLSWEIGDSQTKDRKEMSLLSEGAEFAIAALPVDSESIVAPTVAYGYASASGMDSKAKRRLTHGHSLAMAIGQPNAIGVYQVSFDVTEKPKYWAFCIVNGIPFLDTWGSFDEVVDELSLFVSENFTGEMPLFSPPMRPIFSVDAALAKQNGIKTIWAELSDLVDFHYAKFTLGELATRSRTSQIRRIKGFDASFILKVAAGSFAVGAGLYLYDELTAGPETVASSVDASMFERNRSPEPSEPEDRDTRDSATRMAQNEMNDAVLIAFADSLLPRMSPGFGSQWPLAVYEEARDFPHARYGYSLSRIQCQEESAPNVSNLGVILCEAEWANGGFGRPWEFEAWVSDEPMWSSFEMADDGSQVLVSWRPDLEPVQLSQQSFLPYLEPTGRRVLDLRYALLDLDRRQGVQVSHGGDGLVEFAPATDSPAHDLELPELAITEVVLDASGSSISDLGLTLNQIDEGGVSVTRYGMTFDSTFNWSIQAIFLGVERSSFTNQRLTETLIERSR